MSSDRIARTRGRVERLGNSAVPIEDALAAQPRGAHDAAQRLAHVRRNFVAIVQNVPA